MNLKCSIAVLVAFGLSLSGCDAVKKALKKESTEDAPAVASATPPPPPPATVAPVDQAADVPTPEDFEEEAFKDVTSANYEAELDRLEKDITKDAAPVKAAAQ